MTCLKLRFALLLAFAFGVALSVKPMVRESFSVGDNGEVKAAKSVVSSASPGNLGAIGDTGLQNGESASQQIKHAHNDECTTQDSRTQVWSKFQKADIETRHKLLDGAKVIVEVGGNIGEDLSAFVKNFPNSRIFSLEPMPGFFKTLTDKFGSNKLVTLEQIGVSDKDDTLELNNDGPGTSAYDSTGKGKHVKVPIKDMDAVLTHIKEITGQIPDVVSVNCEGCEYTTLKRMADKNWIGTVPYVQMSWHNVDRVEDRVKHRCEVDEILREKYDPVFFSDFGWQGWKLRQ